MTPPAPADPGIVAGHRACRLLAPHRLVSPTRLSSCLARATWSLGGFLVVVLRRQEQYERPPETLETDVVLHITQRSPWLATSPHAVAFADSDLSTSCPAESLNELPGRVRPPEIACGISEFSPHRC